MFEELTIFETAIADIEQRQEALRVRQHELQGRLEDVEQKLTWLEEERRKILGEAAEAAAAKATRDARSK